MDRCPYVTTTPWSNVVMAEELTRCALLKGHDGKHVMHDSYHRVIDTTGGVWAIPVKAHAEV
jgi:hypothetical protein